jgi:hypothetical protein
VIAGVSSRHNAPAASYKTRGARPRARQPGIVAPDTPLVRTITAKCRQQRRPTAFVALVSFQILLRNCRYSLQFQFLSNTLMSQRLDVIGGICVGKLAR